MNFAEHTEPPSAPPQQDLLENRLAQVALSLEQRYVRVEEATEALRAEIGKVRLSHDVLQSLVLMHQSGMTVTGNERIVIHALPSSAEMCGASVTSAPHVEQAPPGAEAPRSRQAPRDARVCPQHWPHTTRAVVVRAAQAGSASSQTAAKNAATSRAETARSARMRPSPPAVQWGRAERRGLRRRNKDSA